ncbi:hypothetical protein [Kitasatospora sp. NPDC057223]|uniref:hypothetical protein n=1 Tax=Kitasatospora sp. NPDC057223 TaxID=3346055 RepID=UPI00363B0F79
MSETNPAPTVASAEDGLLDYADAITGVSVTIPSYAGFTAGDVVELHWGGTSVTEPYTVPQGEGEQPITLTIPWETIQAAGDGEAIPVHYTVTDRAGNTSAPSQAVDLTITNQT